MICLPATIENISTRVDKTLKIIISTQETTSEQSSKLFSLHQKFGWFLFDENDIKEKDVPLEPAPEFKTDKSPSQRLRAVLYVYWEENTKKNENFDDFYKKWIEKKIGEIKEYLPEKYE